MPGGTGVRPVAFCRDIQPHAPLSLGSSTAHLGEFTPIPPVNSTPGEKVHIHLPLFQVLSSYGPLGVCDTPIYEFLNYCNHSWWVTGTLKRLWFEITEISNACGTNLLPSRAITFFSLLLTQLFLKVMKTYFKVTAFPNCYYSNSMLFYYSSLQICILVTLGVT